MQRSFWIIIAEKERPEALPAPFGIGEADDQNSSRLRHLTLSQLALRPGRYGSVRRFEMMPSSP